MTAECLGLEYNFKEIDLMKGEHMTPEYLKINPMHNIPAIVDGKSEIHVHDKDETVLYCTVLYCTVLYCTVLYCT